MLNSKANSSAGCVYCLHNGYLSGEQVLLRGENFYLCAPNGQIVEGFLAIVPYDCSGALREQGRLAEAANEYDEGYRIDQRYGIVSSYNALNRLLTRLLLRDSPSDRDSKLGRVRDRLDIDGELHKVRTLLERLSESNPADYWASGDLAIVSALTGDGRAIKRSLARFAVPSTPEFAYDAYLKTLVKLLGLKHPYMRHLKTMQRELLRTRPKSA
jgi:hypothetical protein